MIEIRMINHTIGELGVMFQLDQAILRKGFLKNFGMTVDAYIKMTKMIMVFELLTKKSTKLSEVAAAAGYRSWQQLDRAFTDYYGCDMEQLRRAM
jgi:methylphosphotriester-DNA--protein-cysteine methyltransferase